MTAALVTLGAFLGAPLRYFVGYHLDQGAFLGARLRLFLGHNLDQGSRGVSWPTGTMLANVLGSFLLGWASSLALSGEQMAFLGVGFCGAFTTYSTFAVQAVALGPIRGTAYSVVTVGGSLAACALGFLL